MEKEELKEKKINEEEIYFDQETFMSFIVGIRGNQKFDCKTNVSPCMVTDYIEAIAGIEMNILVTILKSGGIELVENYLKMKEILILDSVRNIELVPDRCGMTDEEYANLRALFHIDELVEKLSHKNDEAIAEAKGIKLEDENEEPIRITRD